LQAIGESFSSLEPVAPELDIIGIANRLWLSHGELGSASVSHAVFHSDIVQLEVGNFKVIGDSLTSGATNVCVDRNSATNNQKQGFQHLLLLLIYYNFY